MNDLAGKAAVVTGAASGIGYALAEQLGRAGMRVVAADVEELALDAAVNRLTAGGMEAIGVRTDVSSWPAVEHLAARAQEAFGPIHVVCNNAGVDYLGVPSWDTPLSVWEWILGVDLWGVIHGIRAFVPAMVQQGEGHVINTSSLAGLIVSPDHAPYTVAKHAVVGLSESLYHEFRVRQLQLGVSVLCPAMVQSRILESDRNWRPELGKLPEHGDYHQDAKARMATAMPASVVAEHAVEAIRTGRFWVLPTGHADKVVDRFATVGTACGPPQLWGSVQRGHEARPAPNQGEHVNAHR